MRSTEPTRELTLLQTPRNVDRRIAGVCGALGQRWQVDPLLVRVAAVLLLLSSGVGAVLYGAGWMLMPAKANTRAPIEHVFPGAARWSRRRVVWSVVIASIFVVILVGKFTPGGTLPLVILAAVWFFARRRKARLAAAAARNAPPAPVEHHQPWGYGAWSAADAHAGQLDHPPTDFDRAVQAWQQRLHQVALTQDSAPATFATPQTSLTTTSSGRRPVPSWGRGLALLGIAAGVFLLSMLAFSASTLDGDTSKALLVPASLALGVIAIGLLVGSRIGRPRLAVAAGLVLSVLVVASIVSPFDTVVPTVSSSEVTTIDELPADGLVIEGQALDLGLGDLVLDEDVTVPVTVNGGLLNVTLPAGYAVVIEYTLNGGLLDLPGESYLGTAAGTWTNGVRGSPTLTLVVMINGGSVSLS